GDVDARLAEKRAEPADPPRLVVVDREEHVRLEVDLDLVAERAYETRLGLAPAWSAGDDDLVSFAGRGDADEAREVAGCAASLLGHLDPALGSEERRVHVVHRLLDPPLERAVQRGDGEETCVVLGELAEVGEPEPRRTGLR